VVGSKGVHEHVVGLASVGCIAISRMASMSDGVIPCR
jgi:hypothetical protein